jgi:tRNA G10  N-methylase Trm11
MELKPFYDAMEKIFESASKTLKKGGYLAFIISSSKGNNELTFHGFELAKRAEKYLQLVEWIDVPYSTQVHGGAFVKMAQEQKKILYLRRDLVVFRNGV